MPEPLKNKKIAASEIRVVGILVATFLCIIFLLISLNRANDKLPNTYVPLGYIERIDDLIETSVLKYNTGDRQDPLDWGNIYFDEDAASDLQISFYQQSKRLREDIDLFNESGGGIFSVKNRPNSTSSPIKFDSHAYNFPLPYPKRKIPRSI